MTASRKIRLIEDLTQIYHNLKNFPGEPIESAPIAIRKIADNLKYILLEFEEEDSEIIVEMYDE